MDLGNHRPGGRLPPPSLGGMLNNPFLGTYCLRRKSLAADDEALYSVHDMHACIAAAYCRCRLTVQFVLKERVHSFALIRRALPDRQVIIRVELIINFDDTVIVFLGF
jgi:hypothetical protein